MLHDQAVELKSMLEMLVWILFLSKGLQTRVQLFFKRFDPIKEVLHPNQI